MCCLALELNYVPAECKETDVNRRGDDMLRILLSVLCLFVLSGCTPSGLEKFRDAMLGKTDDPAVLSASSPKRRDFLTVLSPQEEALVKEAAERKTLVSTELGIATFGFEENGFIVVSYAVKGDTSVPSIKCVVRDNTVVALSEQANITSIDPYAFSFAAKVAQQKHNGILSDIPVLYKWHAFEPEVYDSCTILVREKDENTVYFVYRLDVCKK